MSVQGKSVLVTGATAGIGRQTALELARRGAHVVVVGRDGAKLERVVAELRRESGNERVDGLRADFTRLAEVRALAAEFLARFGVLHVLVNNAGAVFLERGLSADGHELTFAVNHLAPFLLTGLLLPALERGAPARIVNVASEGHRPVQLDFDDLQAERSYFSFGVYGRSKLMNLLFTRELARRLEGRGVTVNALHPGVVASDFMRKPGLFGATGYAFMQLFASSLEKGARTSVFLASAPEVEGVTGRYFSASKERQPSRAAQDDEAARRLWELSERLTTDVSAGGSC